MTKLRLERLEERDQPGVTIYTFELPRIPGDPAPPEHARAIVADDPHGHYHVNETNGRWAEIIHNT